MSDPGLQIVSLSLQAYRRIHDEIDRYWVPGRTPMLHPLFVYEFGNLSVASMDGDDVAGFVLGVMATTGPEAYVHAIAVRDDYRRRGVAADMYDEFTVRADRLGADTVKAIVRPDNDASIALHRSLGMASVLHPEYGGPGEDRLVFRKAIT